MNERATFVYRLRVTVPPESADPDWYPDDPDYQQRFGYEGDTGAKYTLPFVWPRRRLYLSSGAATRRAGLLRRWGATVEIEKSEAVAWEANS